MDPSGRALGVWYYQHGVKKYAIASKEVIVSAGTFDSPKLLMLSGIGPKKSLNSSGVSQKIDQSNVCILIWRNEKNVNENKFYVCLLDKDKSWFTGWTESTRPCHAYAISIYNW